MPKDTPKRYKDIPIIALTTATMIENRHKVLAAGMNDHLPKPIEKEKLCALLQNYLTQDESMSEASHQEKEFSQALQEMQEQLSTAAFMEHQYLERFYEKAKPFTKAESLIAFREAVEEFELDRALELLSTMTQKL